MNNPLQDFSKKMRYSRYEILCLLHTFNILVLHCTCIALIQDWCVSGCEIPICKRCGRRQSLVVQVYAPLEGSIHHRTLYVFACVTQECWNRPQR